MSINDSISAFKSFSDDLSQQINNLEQTNPFDSLGRDLSKHLTSSASADDIYAAGSSKNDSPVQRGLKRSRNTSGSPSIGSNDNIILPTDQDTNAIENRKIKKVTFQLQGGQSHPQNPNPENRSDWELSDSETNLIDKDNPIREYSVSDDAYESWKVALNARRNEAKLQIRIFHLQAQIKEDTLPAWSYGLSPCPEYINPFPMEAIKGAHQRAHDIAQLCLTGLQLRMQSEKRKAEKFVRATEELYTEVGDPNYKKAEKRMVAMVVQARKREHDLHRKPSNINLPESREDPEWAKLLPRRRYTDNSRSRSRSGSKERRAKQGSPKPSNRGGFNNRRSGRPGPRNNQSTRGRGGRGSNNNSFQNKGGGPSYENNSYNDYDYTPNSRENTRGGSQYRGKPNKRPLKEPRFPNSHAQNDEELFFLEGFRAGKAAKKS
jgi:hypothetical protein